LIICDFLLFALLNLVNFLFISSIYVTNNGPVLVFTAMDVVLLSKYVIYCQQLFFKIYFCKSF